MSDATVIPFPAVRRRASILKAARHVATYRGKSAQGVFQGRLEIHWQALLRKGVSRDVADSDTRALSFAIRKEVHRIWRAEDCAGEAGGRDGSGGDAA